MWSHFNAWTRGEQAEPWVYRWTNDGVLNDVGVLVGAMYAKPLNTVQGSCRPCSDAHVACTACDKLPSRPGN